MVNSVRDIQFNIIDFPIVKGLIQERSQKNFLDGESPLVVSTTEWGFKGNLSFLFKFSEKISLKYFKRDLFYFCS